MKWTIVQPPTVRLHVVHHPVAVDVGVQARRREQHLAQRAPAVQVQHLDALLPVVAVHVVNL